MVKYYVTMESTDYFTYEIEADSAEDAARLAEIGIEDFPMIKHVEGIMEVTRVGKDEPV